MTPEEYAAHDGTGLADLVRRGEIEATELVELAVGQIEAWNPAVNAVIEKFYDSARAAATSVDKAAPFCGVPFLMKDLLTFWKGERMHCGTRLLRDFVPDHDGEMAARFRKAGVITLGKTNVPELGIMPVTEPEAFGPTRTPWDLSRTSGGSSGGSAAAVASRMVPIAHGSDGGGSIRLPAACCGVVGLKPTRGRNPIGPDMGQAWQGFAVDHVLTRTVRDTASMLDATCGPDAGALYVAAPPARPFLEEVGADPGKLRVAFTTKPILGHDVHAECLAGVTKTTRLLEDLGHTVFEATPDIDGAAFARAFMTMVCAETAADMGEAMTWAGESANHAGFEDTTRILGMLGRRTSACGLSEALRLMHRAARVLGRFFENCDVLLSPTTSEPPLVIGALRQTGFEAAMARLLVTLNNKTLAAALAGVDALAEKAFDFLPWTPLFNASGQPAVSLPLHWTNDGLPVGIHFAARFGEEATLIRLAAQLESSVPWRDRAPSPPPNQP